MKVSLGGRVRIERVGVSAAWEDICDGLSLASSIYEFGRCASVLYTWEPHLFLQRQGVVKGRD